MERGAGIALEREATASWKGVMDIRLLYKTGEGFGFKSFALVSQQGSIA